MKPPHNLPGFATARSCDGDVAGEFVVLNTADSHAVQDVATTAGVEGACFMKRQKEFAQCVEHLPISPELPAAIETKVPAA